MHTATYIAVVAVWNLTDQRNQKHRQKRELFILREKRFISQQTKQNVVLISDDRTYSLDIFKLLRKKQV